MPNSPPKMDARALGALIFTTILVLFFLGGASSLVYQVVWTRKLVLLFGTTAYAVSVVLSVFFLGLGLGSLMAGRFADRTPRPLAWFGVAQIIIGLWAVAFILGIAASEAWVVEALRGVAESRAGGITLRALLVAAFLLVPVTLMGATLPLLTRFVMRGHAFSGRGFRIGTLYSVNTLGAVVGTAAAGFLLVPAMGYLRATLLAAALDIAVGIAALVLSRRHEASAGALGDGLSAEIPLGPPFPKGEECARAANFNASANSGHDMNSGQRDTAATQPMVHEVPPFEKGGAGGISGHSPPRQESDVSPRMPALIVMAFALTGFCSLAFEVLWTRMLAILFIGTTYAYTTMLTTLLCGIALGGGTAALLIDRRVFKNYVGLFGLLCAAIGVTCIAMLPIFAEMPDRVTALRGTSGHNWPAMVRGYFLLSASALFIPTFLLGMTFPVAVRAATGDAQSLGRGVGRLYAANTFGGVLGALAGGFLVLPTLGVHNGSLVLGGLLVLGGAALILACPDSTRRGRVIGIGVTAACCLVLIPMLPTDVGRALNRWFVPSDQQVIHYTEGVEGTVLVSEPVDHPTGSDRVLWINAVQATASIEKGVRMNRFQGGLPLLFDRPLNEALFMCFGSGVTAGTLGQWEFERIDAVEISRDVLAAAPFFAQDNFAVVDNPRINFIVDDGRNFLLTTQRDYDLITFEPMPLALAGVSTFYTEEYYRLCRARLRPGGLVSQWIPLHSLTPGLVRDLARTFYAVFPESCVFFINADLFLIGSNEPLRINPALVEERLAQPAIRGALAPFGLDDPVEFLASFFMGAEALGEWTGEGPRMRDDRPWAEFVAPKVMFDRQVDLALRELQPHHESPLDLMVFDDEAEETRWRDAIMRRHESKRNEILGLIDYYGAGAFGNPEEHFMRALEIDPNNANARYYLKEVCGQRHALLMRWAEYENGAAQMRVALQYMGDEPELHRYLADFLAHLDDHAAARHHYEQFVALGGDPARVKESLKSLPQP